MKKNWFLFLGTIVFIVFFWVGTISAQTTGKISGKVVDKETGEPLPGAQVMITGIWLEGIEVEMASPIGGVADINGNYFIINVDPGKYTVKAQMIGYKTGVVKEVEVSVNRTTRLNFELEVTAIQGEEVVVQAEKIDMKKDQTSSIKNVSSDKIQALPVEEIQDVIAMQAGIIGNHFRGGRSTEVSYMIDGIQVDESFSGDSRIVDLDKEVVQDLEVITGTFNAEYGRAMSGIVNMVTKDGGNQFRGSASVFASNYYTGHHDIFIGLKNTDFFRKQDYKFQFEGPIIKNKVTFFFNARYEDNKNHLVGINRFEPDNYSDFTTPNIIKTATRWDVIIRGNRYYSEHTGDNSYVDMDWNKRYSFFGKLAIRPISNIKLSFSTIYEDEEGQGYSHSSKYKPHGRATNYHTSKIYIGQLNHLITNSLFYDLKLSYNDSHDASYLYSNPLDKRYISDMYSRGAAGFSTGGMSHGRYDRYLKDLNIKYDLTWQVNNNHNVKTGFLYIKHEVKNWPTYVRNKYYNLPIASQFYYDYEQGKVVFPYYEPEILPDSSIAMDRYIKKPYEFSAYIQDKMEFEALVINMGVRYDYFNSNTKLPSNWRNPSNQLSFPDNPERMSVFKDADPQVQISPRFGLSYTLGSSAVLHFSYGHFFQMPPLYALYTNHRFMIPPTDFATVIGNPNIKAEKTVQYEMGVWQEIMPGMSLELSVYYKDIYDLQSAVVYTTYNQIKYGLYSNKDYGNSKGLELKYDYTTGPLNINLNYTLQYTRGNADNPTSTFSRAGQNLDPVPILIPLAWDQRHTFNASVSYMLNHLSLTMTGYFNTGRPYSYVPPSESPLSKQNLLPNNARMPSQVRVDFKGRYDLSLSRTKKVRFYLNIYNLLDRLNEVSVNPTTGRAYTAIIREAQRETFRSNFCDIEDAYKNPAMYSAPREIKFGIGIVF